LKEIASEPVSKRAHDECRRDSVSALVTVLFTGSYETKIYLILNYSYASKGFSKIIEKMDQ